MIRGGGAICAEGTSVRVFGFSELSHNRVVEMYTSGAYRVTSLIRKRTPLGPYRRPMPMVLGSS